MRMSVCTSRESRYLLLLTENYGGLRILTDNLLNGRDIVPIFGSSFPKDQEYTQVSYHLVHCYVAFKRLRSDTLFLRYLLHTCKLLLPFECSCVKFV